MVGMDKLVKIDGEGGMIGVDADGNAPLILIVRVCIGDLKVMTKRMILRFISDFFLLRTRVDIAFRFLLDEAVWLMAYLSLYKSYPIFLLFLFFPQMSFEFFGVRSS